MLKFFNPRVFFAWILSVTFTSFVLGFLGGFYFTFFEIILLTVVLQSLIGLFIHLLFGKAKQLHVSQPVDLALALALFLVLAAFALTMFGMAKQFPRLFDAGYFVLKNGQLVPFIAGSVLVLPCLAWGLRFVNQSSVKQTAAYHFMNEIVAGLLIAGFFFIVYLIIASIFNQPVFDVDDIFFDVAVMGVMDGQTPSLSPLDDIPDQPVLIAPNRVAARPDEMMQMDGITSHLVGANIGHTAI
jgi:hypothetical protein